MYHWEKGDNAGSLRIIAVKQAVNEMTKGGKKECGKEERKHQWRVRTKADSRSARAMDNKLNGKRC